MIGFNAVLLFNYSRVIDPILRRMRDCTPDFSVMKPGDRVLDVCCGTGEQVLGYARSQTTAIGIDHDPGMLAIAEKNRRRRRLENVSFLRAQAHNLPFRDGLLDCVSISLGLHENDRPAGQAIIAEMKRVTRRQGTLVFIDFEAPLPRNVCSVLIRIVERIAGRGNLVCFKRYLQQGGLDELLRANGLRQDKRRHFLKGTIAVIKATRA